MTPLSSEEEFREMLQKRLDTHTKILMAVIALLVTIGGGINGWTVLQVMEAHKKIQEIRQDFTEVSVTRFTSKDGFNLNEKFTDAQKEILKEISGLQREVAQLPSKLPPTWFKQKVEKNCQRISDLEHKTWGKGKR